MSWRGVNSKYGGTYGPRVHPPSQEGELCEDEMIACPCKHIGTEHSLQLSTAPQRGTPLLATHHRAGPSNPRGVPQGSRCHACLSGSHTSISVTGWISHALARQLPISRACG